jgi:peptide/nickel transport system ATP-binding protein
VAAVYVSHDLAVVRNLVDRVVVLYAGRIVETAPLADLFERPRHPYTQGLLGAVPDLASRRALQPIPGQAPVPGTRPHGCAFAPRCPLAAPVCGQLTPTLDEIRAGHHVACHRLDAGRAFAPGRLESAVRSDARREALLDVRSLEAFYGHRQVLFDVSLEVAPGECVAVVGESGSGKTTTARAIAGLGEHARGEIHFNGKPLSLRARQRPLALRRQIQYIFQNPYRALNPRHTVGVTLTHALRHFFDITPREAESRAIETLERVSLQRELLNVYPRELSGGERQRVAIARALVCEPSLLVCDEITSALDVSVQANILALLRDLQSSGLALLFVTHGLGIVRTIADRVVVLHEGRVVEHGAVDQVLDRPAAEYTRTLVRDSPTLDIASSPSEIVRLDSRPPVVRELVSQGIPE